MKYPNILSKWMHDVMIYPGHKYLINLDFKQKNSLKMYEIQKCFTAIVINIIMLYCNSK